MVADIRSSSCLDCKKPMKVKVPVAFQGAVPISKRRCKACLTDFNRSLGYTLGRAVPAPYQDRRISLYQNRALHWVSLFPKRMTLRGWLMKQVAKVGSKVILQVPENKRLDGAKGTITSLHEWGAKVTTPAAATGEFRAYWNEFILDTGKPGASMKQSQIVGTQSRTQSVATGDACRDCGSFAMTRTGTCLTCQDCGSTSGGCS